MKLIKMPRCPNCSYILVLLENRNKYKCAKCGKLYPKKEVESKEFREYNKREKEKDKEEFERQLKLRRKLLRSNGLSPQEIQKKLQEYRAKYYLKHKDKFKKAFSEYNQKNKDAISIRHKDWSKNNREKVNLYNKKSRLKYLEERKTCQNILDWRYAQRGLAIKILEEFSRGWIRRIKADS